MRENGGNPPGRDTANAGDGGVRVPFKGESSSPNASPHTPSDADTIFGAPSPGSPPLPARPVSHDSPTLIGGGASAPAGSSYSRAMPGYYTDTGEPVLTDGSIIAQRYEILSLLGEGGMGAVYKARDIELGRMVAFKVIRRELSGNRAILDRFKQELILATQVTHRNVVRIYDLGEADGLKFITMEFVDGEDLRTVIHQRKKIPPREAVVFIEQICRALEAAHGVGVIHRDLKPQNIMLDKGGRILVMDFGLARTLGGEGMTQTGAMVGTMEYMSPEQALAQSLDQRSDLFSLGLIFYELLTGATPFRADSALASLIKRTQERVVPVSDLDHDIPVALSQIVSKCLEREVEQRYQSASELLADLELWLGTGKSGVMPAIQPPPVKPSRAAKKWWVVAACSVLVLLPLGYYAVRSRGILPEPQSPQATAATRSLAIVPFRNASGNAQDDWIGTTVADVLGTAIGQSSHVRAVPADRLRQILSDLRVGPETLVDAQTLKRVAQFSNANVVVSGQYALSGDRIILNATVRDLVHDQTVPVTAQAPSKDLPAAIDALADSIRKNLSLSASVVDELKAQSFKPNSKSVVALREYDQGAGLMRAGRYIDALKHLQAATEADSEFALAFSALAATQADLGFQTAAEQSSIRAADLAQNQNLPLLEKYLISAANARIMKDSKKAIEAYQNLQRSSPGDVDVQFALGSLYLQSGQYDKAREEFSGILQTDAKNIQALWGVGVVNNLTGNPQAALEALTRGSSLAIQADNDEQQALILLSTGISYRLLSKPEEALRNYQQSIAINEKIGQKRGMAAAWNEVGEVQRNGGKPDLALESYHHALDLLREIGMKDEMANTLTNMGTVYQDLGKFDSALDVYKQALEIQREASDQSYEALCLDNIAGVYLAMGDTGNAFTYSQQALQLREKLGVGGDIADTLETLSEAYTATGQYDQGMTALMRALDLSRTAGDGGRTAVIAHQIGLVLGFQGRYGGAVKSLQDAVKSFHAQGENGLNMAEFQIDLADALARAGRGDETAAPLKEAETIQQALKNEGLLAAILNTRGDIALDRGDVRGAVQFYKTAEQAAVKSKENEVTLLSKLNVARATVAGGQFAEGLRQLQSLQTANGAGTANLALQIQLVTAEAAIGLKDYSRANHILEQQLFTAKRAGMRFDLARIYYLMASAARLSGNAERAGGSYREAAQILEEMRGDPGAENILRRVDVATMYNDANRWKK